MPKVSHRCRTRTYHVVHQPVSAPFMAAPRKVSFEDNFPEVETTPSSPLPSPVLKPVSGSFEAKPALSRKSTLARPKSSMSLVELAQSVEAEESSSCSSSPITNHHATMSAPVSPQSSPRLAPCDASPSFQLPSSPWGQFVEMAVSDGESRLPAATQHSYEAPCTCCLVGRRCRANPYGDYRTSKKCSSSDHQKSSLGLFQDSESWSHTHRSFRLAPRKGDRDPAHQLIGALDRLQVD
jgi:hypothetical protein